jgi:hypothetical protein
VAQALITDGVNTFEGQSAMDLVGYEMSKTCADKVFKEAGFAEGQGRDEVGVVELHDCFAANEVIYSILTQISSKNTVVFSSLHIPLWDYVHQVMLINLSSVGTIPCVSVNCCIQEFIHVLNSTAGNM